MRASDLPSAGIGPIGERLRNDIAHAIGYIEAHAVYYGGTHPGAATTAAMLSAAVTRLGGGGATAPAQVGTVTPTAGNGQVALAWAAPSSGGSPITDYRVEYKASASPTWLVFTDGVTSSTGATVTGLTNGTAYDFRVSAINVIGTGTASATATSTPTSGVTAPAQVGTVTPTAGNGQVVLAWSAPANGGSAITDYLVEYKASSSGTWLTFSDGVSTTTGATVTGLTNGTAYDFRVSAINAIGTGTASAVVSATPNVSAPALANRVAHWDAGTITPQTDDTGIASWVDQINGLAMNQATSANQPRYRTGAGSGGIGGHPCVQFNGDQLLEAAHSGTALRTTLETGTYSVMAIMRSGSGNRQYGAILAGATTNSGMIFAHSGQLVGRYDNAVRGYVPYNTFMAVGISGTNTTGLRVNVDGSILGQVPGTNGGVSGTLFRIGGIPGQPTTVSMTGQILEIVVYNKELTPLEIIEFSDYACAKYGQANPRTGLAKFMVFEGDSITSGVGADLMRYNYPVIASAAAGYSYGQWTNLARGGSTWSTMANRAAQADALIAKLGSTPVHLCVWEFYNHRALSTVIPDFVIPYLNARKTAGFAKTIFGTTTDYQSVGAEKAAYCNYWDNSANRAGLIDAYVPIHTDTNLGVDGAQANTTYFVDFAHLTGKSGYPTTQSGYPALAALFQPHL